MAVSKVRFSIQHHGHKGSENTSIGTSSRSALEGEGIVTRAIQMYSFRGVCKAEVLNYDAVEGVLAVVYYITGFSSFEKKKS